jgi:hypothetical protein
MRVIAKGRRSGSAMIEVKQSAKPFGFANALFAVTCSLIGERDDIIKSLMIAFALMVDKRFLERVAQGTFAE